MINKHIILASGSPRRKELLQKLGFNFKTYPSEADESVEEGTPPETAVTELALRKALWVKERVGETESVILAADTLVFLDSRLLGKPADEADAFDMLKRLSGRVHEVYTGIAVLCGDETIVDFEKTRVFFRDMDDSEIHAYIATGDPMDKAGAYGIQEKGGVFVERVEGDYFNVLGLPLCKTYSILKIF